MQKHRREKAQNRHKDFQRNVARLPRYSKPDSGHASKERVNEGRDDAAQDEESGQTVSSHHRSLAVILEVLGHGKAKSNHSRIDNAINDAVKLILFPPEEDENYYSLRRLFDDWRGINERVVHARKAVVSLR